MNELQTLIGHQIESGIYFLPKVPPSLGEAAQADGYSFIFVNGAAIESKSSFLAAFAEALNFPDYFGGNWDAFEECMNDLQWRPSQGYILLYDHFHIFAISKPFEFRIAIDILRAAADSWKENGTVFIVFLAGEEAVAREFELPVVDERTNFSGHE